MLASEYAASTSGASTTNLGGRSTGSLGLEKAKQNNSLSLFRQQCIDQAAKINTDCNALLESLRSGSDAAEVDKLKEDIIEARDAALAQIKLYQEEKHGQLKGILDGLASADEAKALAVRIKETGMELTKGKLKEWAKLRQSSSTFVRNIARRGKTQVAASNTFAIESADAPVNPFYEVLRQLKVTNVSKSIYEAKAGVRAACIAGDAPERVCEFITKNKLVKTNIGKAHASMKQTQQTWVASPLDPGTPKSKAFLKAIGKLLDPAFTAMHVLPDEGWAHKVAAADVIVVNETRTKSVKTSATQYASCEIRCYIEGSTEDVICGIPVHKVDGENWREKRRTLQRLTIDDMNTLIGSTGGFVLTPKAGDVVVLPTGSILATASASSLYVRWITSGDVEDTSRVIACLDAMCSEYPEVRNPKTGNAEFLEFLQSTY